ncbi:hypothetical protein [Bdellovibrio bacteriovorus]|nr:hypothetical protein [Bdellovibrio bacteriovorus]
MQMDNVQRWKVVRGGAIANRNGLPGFNDETAERIKSLLYQGRYLLTTVDTQSRIEIGRIASALQEILGKSFWETVGQHWLRPVMAEGEVLAKFVSNRRRHLEISMQMFRFAVSAGRACPRSIPADSYVHIMREVEKIRETPQKKRFIKILVNEGKKGTVDLYRTKRLREELRVIREEIFGFGDRDLKEKQLKRKVHSLWIAADAAMDRISSLLASLNDDIGKVGVISPDTASDIQEVLATLKVKRIEQKEQCMGLEKAKDQSQESLV